MWTTIHFVPKDRTFEPNLIFVRELLDILSPTLLEALFGYSAPLDWDTDKQQIRRLTMSNVPVDELFRVAEDKKGLVTLCAVLVARAWSRKIWESLLEYRAQTTGAYAPSLLSIVIGPSSIPSWDREETQSTQNFLLDISGDGMPNRFRSYLASIESDQTILELKSHLEKLSKSEWDLLLSSSY